MMGKKNILLTVFICLVIFFPAVHSDAQITTNIIQSDCKGLFATGGDFVQPNVNFVTAGVTYLDGGSDCDDFTIVIDGHSVYILHEDGFYNCCAEMAVDVTLDNTLITAEEYETFPEGPCYCMCYFDILTVIEYLESGTYTLEYWNENFEELLCSAEIVIA